MAASLIDTALTNFYHKIQIEIHRIKCFLSICQYFTDLLDEEIFYKELSDRLPGNLLPFF